MTGEMTDHDAPFRQRSWLQRWVRVLVHRLRIWRVAGQGRFHFAAGPHLAIARGADVRPPHYVELGHHVSIGKNFTCEADLRVGNYVLISSNVSIIGKDHPFDDPTKTVYTQPRVDHSPVTIGSDVLLGFGTIVVGPVTIGDGCIIGAGAVVTRDLPPYTICMGVPAKPIRPRYQEASAP